jgi:hypothetical protein
VSKTKFPVADIAVSEEFVVTAGTFKPDVGAKAALVVVLPVASVLLVGGDPVHNALTVTLIQAPLALIVVPGSIGHLAFTALHTLLPFTLVNRAVAISEYAVAVAEASDPLSFIHNSFLRVGVCTAAMSEAVNNLAFIVAAIGPVVAAITSDLILPELPLVLGAVMPQEFSLAMQETVLHLTLEGVALSELAGSLAVIHLADLNWRLESENSEE